GLARQAGALTFVDSVHYTPHALVDVGALGCDFFACSSYKYYGPHVGILYGRHDLLNALDVPKLLPASDTAPERLETGTLNHEGIVGAGAAVDFLASLAGEHGREQGRDLSRDRREALRIAYGQLHAHGDALVRRLWDGLGTVPRVTRHGPPPGTPRTPTVSFTVDGISSGDVARSLARRGVFVSNGDFYATTVVERLGHADGGLVRAGCACYTDASEVDRLVEGVAALTTD
nr:aminotransferase class V-fold PLP-dependent enzyme [Gemmatimonadales bacterium]